MPKATPSKGDLPKKPKPVREVKDAALYEQRVKQYEADLKIYHAAMVEYEKGQKARGAAKAAAKRKAASEEGGGAKKAQRSAPVPGSKGSTPRSSSGSSKKALKPPQLLTPSAKDLAKQPAAPAEPTFQWVHSEAAPFPKVRALLMFEPPRIEDWKLVHDDSDELFISGRVYGVDKLLRADLQNPDGSRTCIMVSNSMAREQALAAVLH